jgi:hypothetical protein
MVAGLSSIDMTEAKLPLLPGSIVLKFRQRGRGNKRPAASSSVRLGCPVKGIAAKEKEKLYASSKI